MNNPGNIGIICLHKAPVTFASVIQHINRLIEREGSCTEKLIRQSLNKAFKHDTSQNEYAITYMLERDVINDKRYIKNLFVSYSSRCIGINNIKKELFKKGFSKALIDEHIEGVDSTSQLKKAIAIKERKYGKGKITEQKVYVKLFRYLVGRGFDANTITQAL